MSAFWTRSWGPLGVLAALLVALAGAVWLPQWGSAPEVSAQEAVQSACERMEQVDSYDISVRHPATDGERDLILIVDFKVSGNDYEGSWTVDGEAEPYVRFMRVGGVNYMNQGQGWELYEHTFLEINQMFPAGDSLPCPEVGDLRNVGTETLNGVLVKHYNDASQGDTTAGQPNSAGTPTGVHPSKAADFWVDKSGQIVQLARNIPITKQTATGSEEATIQVVSTFSGVGQANVITAPVVP